jgi:hypothetical protein
MRARFPRFESFCKRPCDEQDGLSSPGPWSRVPPLNGAKGKASGGRPRQAPTRHHEQRYLSLPFLSLEVPSL